MRTIAICLVGSLALAACAESEPVDETRPTPVPTASLPADVARPAELRTDTGTAAEGDDQSADSAAVAEGEWFAKTERDVPMALFGPPDSESLFSVRCEGGRLVFARSGIPQGRARRMALMAAGDTRRMDATAVEEPLPRVTASLPASDPFAETLASADQPISVRIDGGPALRIPAHEHFRGVAANCRE
jgi:hypothetical protein